MKKATDNKVIEVIELFAAAKLRKIRSDLEFTAKRSTCKRGKCGSVLLSASGDYIGFGFNSLPQNAYCWSCAKDDLPKDFKSDKTCCMHAEQRAIMDALRTYPKLLKGATLFFIRLDENNNFIPAGKPYCTICSKMALDVGIKWFCLIHEDKWLAYDTEYYNQLSFQYKND